MAWRAERPLQDFAVVPVIRADGKVALDPVYPESIPDLKGRVHKLFWPAFDDLTPPSSWKTGRGALHSFLFKLDGPLPNGRLTADIHIFEKRTGPWAALEIPTVPVTRRE
jgi:hypothetical protein